jgi:hypothetical protein
MFAGSLPKLITFQMLYPRVVSCTCPQTRLAKLARGKQSSLLGKLIKTLYSIGPWRKTYKTFLNIALLF